MDIGGATVKIAVPIAILVHLQHVIEQLALVLMGAEQDGLGTDAILVVMLLTVRHVLMMIQTRARTVLMDFIVNRILLVSLALSIVLWEQYAIKVMVLVLAVARIIGQENNVIFRVPQHAVNATS